jgi:hypothetical protein
MGHARSQQETDSFAMANLIFDGFRQSHQNLFYFHRHKKGHRKLAYFLVASDRLPKLNPYF